MKLLHRIFGLLLAAALFCILIPAAGAEDIPDSWETTVLFTHDLHSHFLPQATEGGGESGGYARLKTVLDRERAEHPNALVLDGGDFSVGSLIQTLYTTQAAELRTMGALGYDAVTVGNHEFDNTGVGFAKMLNAAVLSGDPLPALLMANYKPGRDNPDQLDIQRAMAAYGVQEYTLIQRDGITYGIFGIMGEDADQCAPASGFALGDPVENAQRCVDALREEGADFIICLSHSGTSENSKQSEDEQLAKKVDGIDLIISGHSHTTLTEPIVVGNTYIVSAGSYCENLGIITFLCYDNKNGEKTLLDYRLVPIDETLPEDPEISALVEGWKAQVGTAYLSAYGMTYDQVLTRSAFDLKTPESGVQEGNALGELAADSFLWAVENLEADAPSADTVAVTADGVLRASLFAGPITTSQAFDVLSLGVGEDGSAGYPLVAFWLTGKELKTALEIDASVTPVMPAAQLYASGITYSFNVHRMFFNRVTQAYLAEPPFVNQFTASGLTEIKDDQLYRVVTGLYSAQMLGTIKSKSFGLLSLEPKDAQGSPITDFTQCILYDKNGNEIKEWYALASYLASFGENGIPANYSAPDGRKNVSDSWSPIQLLKHLNWIAVVTLLVLAAAAAGIVLLIRRLARFKRSRRYGRVYRRRRWFGR